MRLRRLGTVTLVAGVGACDSDVVDPNADVKTVPVEDVFVQPEVMPTDLLVVVDDRHEALGLWEPLAVKAQDLVPAYLDAESDAHIAVVASTMTSEVDVIPERAVWVQRPGAEGDVRVAFDFLGRRLPSDGMRSAVWSVESGFGRPRDQVHLHIVAVGLEAEALTPWGGTEDAWGTPSAFEAWRALQVEGEAVSAWTLITLPACDFTPAPLDCADGFDVDAIVAATDTRTRTWPLSHPPVESTVEVSYAVGDTTWWGISSALWDEGVAVEEAVALACARQERSGKCFGFHVLEDTQAIEIASSPPPVGTEIFVRYGTPPPSSSREASRRRHQSSR